MLEIVVPEREFFDDNMQEFISTREAKLRLEHSLVSISKWESIYKKPFLTKDEKTVGEFIEYIKCMTITQNVDPNVYYALTSENINQVAEYIEESFTATWFREQKTAPSRQIITSELIYYWMVAYNIPWEAQKWNFSRLMTLIRICNIKSQPDKKMSKRDALAQQRALNAARRAKSGSRG